MFPSSTSRTFDRPASLAASAVAPLAREHRTLPATLVPALLLALVLGKVFGLGVSMHVTADPLRAGRFAAGDAVPTLTWTQMGGQPLTSAGVEAGDPLAHGVITGTVMIESAILPNPDAARQLPPAATFLSKDGVPFQLRTADLTTDAAICSGMGTKATGGYRFDFHDGGLSFGEVYGFLNFVTQSYRPVSLCDQRLLLPRPAQSSGPDMHYVVR